MHMRGSFSLSTLSLPLIYTLTNPQFISIIKLGLQHTVELGIKFRNIITLNPQPSQLRYLLCISRRNLGSDWSPSDTPLALDHIKLKSLPLFGEKSCRPVIRIYSQDSSSTIASRSSKLLFTSSKTKKQARYYQPVCLCFYIVKTKRQIKGVIDLLYSFKRSILTVCPAPNSYSSVSGHLHHDSWRNSPEITNESDPTRRKMLGDRTPLFLSVHENRIKR
ncbi:putative tensin phosphatase, C2 domain-containing protein [Helianthus debilis subsp. tardiflorus]